jgi:MFS family permease
MNNNSNTQQPKLILQKAAYSLTSLILGIISIILPLILIWYGVNFVPSLVFLLDIIVAGICAIVGLTFGIKGLKSTRKKLAIAGIVVCAISLLFLVFMSLVWLMAEGPANL